MRGCLALAALLAVACAAGCGKDDIGPPETDLVGAWHAVTIGFMGKAGQGTADAAAAGWTASLTLASDNTGTLLVTRNDSSSWSWGGAWEVDGDLFRIAGQGADIGLSGGDLRLSGFDSAYDFNTDGTEEPAKLNLVLRK
jgi:hypothetical protein